VNLIFITESLSTLDSTFTSVAKLMGPEFLGILEEGKPRPPQTTTHRWSIQAPYMTKITRNAARAQELCCTPNLDYVVCIDEEATLDY
jgi:hypothetical protein